MEEIEKLFCGGKLKNGQSVKANPFYTIEDLINGDIEKIGYTV